MAYVRKTEDEWQVHGNNGYGWEELSAYTCLKDANTDIRLYRSNQPGLYKLVKRRVKRR